MLLYVTKQFTFSKHQAEHILVQRTLYSTLCTNIAFGKFYKMLVISVFIDANCYFPFELIRFYLYSRPINDPSDVGDALLE